MPTYKNVTDKPITIDLGVFTKTLSPNESIETYYILDDIEGLQRIDDKPFYNPIVLQSSIELTSTNSEKVINLPKNNITTEIRITDVVGTIKVYLNSKENTPPIELIDGDIITITNPNYFDKLIFNSTDGKCRVTIVKVYK